MNDDSDTQTKLSDLKDDEVRTLFMVLSTVPSFGLEDNHPVNRLKAMVIIEYFARGF